MVRPGQIALFRFPFTDLSGSTLRPALVLARVPGRHEDWLICMISTQLHQETAGFDDVIRDTDEDFQTSGLRSASLVRVGRLAVVERDILIGAIGNVSEQRVLRIKHRVSAWLSQ